MTTFDVLIRGGQVVDGSGNPWFYGDLALQGERIAAVEPPGRIPAAAADELVDAAGMVVCPGFIDIQSHSILPLMRDGRSLSKIAQGVTTEIMGEVWTPAPFGGLIDDPFRLSPFPLATPGWEERVRSWQRFGDWLDAMVAQGVSPNIGSFLSGGTLRQYARGMAMGPANDDELGVMRRVTAEAMQDGAFGVAYALIYPPEAYVETAELIEVCHVVRHYGGLYITHLRSESDHFIDATAEAITIGRQADLPVEIYHLKATGQANWHKIPEVIGLIEQTRTEGTDIAANMYPYIAAGTALTVLLPAWVAAGGRLYEQLRDPAVRARIRDEILGAHGSWPGLAPRATNALPVGFQLPEHQQYIGKTLFQIAEARGQDWLDTVCDLLVAEQQSISTIYFMMSEENIQLQLALPWIKISSDAGGFDPAWAQAYGPVHPRAYGTFPRVLGKYVRDEAVLTLEDAIRKMTSAVANRLGLADRGLLRTGAYADVVIFDPATIADRATFADAHQLAAGVHHVWVNGVAVWRAGAHTGATPGHVVRGRGAR